jgi:hypothetical protein
MFDLLLVLHAIANSVITVAAVALFMAAFRNHRQTGKLLKELITKKESEILSRIGAMVAGNDLEDSREIQEEIKSRLEYSEYLRSTKGEALITYPEWMEKRKEVANA